MAAYSAYNTAPEALQADNTATINPQDSISRLTSSNAVATETIAMTTMAAERSMEHGATAASAPGAPYAPPENMQAMPQPVHQVGGEDRPLVDRAKEMIPSRTTGSMAAAIMIMVTNIIGTGIIALPYVMRISGAGVGVMAVIIGGCVAAFAADLLVYSAQLLRRGAESYQSLVEFCYGKPGFFLVSVMQFLHPFITMVSINVIIGDTMTKIFKFAIDEGDSIFADRNVITLVFTLLVTLPLSLYRHMAQLAIASTIHVIIDLFIGVFVVIRLLSLRDVAGATGGDWKFFGWGGARGMLVVAHAVVCHHGIFLIYDTIRDASRKRFAIVSTISFWSSSILMLVVGLAGYSTFTGHTQGDLMENYCYNDVFANVARAFFCFAVAFTYPIECCISREVLMNMVLSEKQRESVVLHGIVTGFLVTTAFASSAITDCLSVVLELNGSLTATPLMFIWPAACYLRVRDAPLLSIRSILAIGTIVTGSVISLTGLAMTGSEIYAGRMCSHGKEPAYCHHGNAVNATAVAMEVANEVLNKTGLL